MLIQQCYKSEMLILLITLLNERRTFILIKVKYWGKKIIHDGKNWAESAALSDTSLCPQRPGEVCGGAPEELVRESRARDGAGRGAEEQRAEDAGRDTH